MTESKKWVLITGALGGIGKALVQEYKANGYSVIATDINRLERKIEENAVFIELDLQKFAKSKKYAEYFYKQVQQVTNEKGIKALVNNAAVQILGQSAELDRNEWRRTFEINLTAPFFLSQLFLGDLEKNSGSIVNISSIHATLTKKEFIAYATSKAALSSMTRNMVLDVGDKVRINAIEPAAISTEMLKAGFEGNTENFKKLKKFHPAGRIGEPKEIAMLSVFLSSESAGFVQGSCINASGGIHACLKDPDI